VQAATLTESVYYQVKHLAYTKDIHAELSCIVQDGVRWIMEEITLHTITVTHDP